MENNNIETVAAPVGTVRKFVSQQYLSDYKTSTLDNAYATKSIASASTNGLMSKDDKIKLDSISTNSQFSITIPSTSWVQDGLLVSSTIEHNMNKKILYMGAYDSASKESLFISYNLIDDTRVKLSIEEKVDAVITIVFEGNIIELVTGDINDLTTSLTSTWSSAKMNTILTNLESSVGEITQQKVNQTIDDTSISKDKTWSSEKIQSSLPTLATTSKDGLLSKSDKSLIDTISGKMDKSSITISTAEPSGGKHGDIWFKYEE